jgi:hypothetical protein
LDDIHVGKYVPPVYVEAESTDSDTYVGTGTQENVDFEDVILDALGRVTNENAGPKTDSTGWRFTAPYTGYYSIKCFILHGPSTTWSVGEIGEMFLYKNGSSFKRLDYYEYNETGPSTWDLSLRGNTTVKLNAGDYINIWIEQNSGSSTNLSATADDNNIAIVSVPIND